MSFFRAISERISLAVCPPNATVPAATGVCTASVTFADAVASDNCALDQQWRVGPASTSVFAVGTTAVTFYANDTTGNSANCVYAATVADTQTPTISKCACEVC